MKIGSFSKFSIDLFATADEMKTEKKFHFHMLRRCHLLSLAEKNPKSL